MAAVMFKSFFPCRSFPVFLRSPLLCANRKTKATKTPEHAVERPKHPHRPQTVFLREKIKDLRKNDPHILPRDMLKKVLGLWKELPESEKNKYCTLYKKLEDKYFNDMYEYYQKLPSQVGDTSPIPKHVLKVWQRKMGKPRRPLPGFIKFAVEHAQKLGKTYRIPDSLTEAREIWKELPEYQKERYLKQAELDRLKYKNEMLQWENKMIEDGHHLLVREKALKLAEQFTAIEL